MRTQCHTYATIYTHTHVYKPTCTHLLLHCRGRRRGCPLQVPRQSLTRSSPLLLQALQARPPSLPLQHLPLVMPPPPSPLQALSLAAPPPLPLLLALPLLLVLLELPLLQLVPPPSFPLQLLRRPASPASAPDVRGVYDCTGLRARFQLHYFACRCEESHRLVGAGWPIANAHAHMYTHTRAYVLA